MICTRLKKLGGSFFMSHIQSYHIWYPNVFWRVQICAVRRGLRFYINMSGDILWKRKWGAAYGAEYPVRHSENASNSFLYEGCGFVQYVSPLVIFLLSRNPRVLKLLCGDFVDDKRRCWTEDLVVALIPEYHICNHTRYSTQTARGNWFLRDQSKPGCGPDWFLRSFSWAPIACLGACIQGHRRFSYPMQSYWCCCFETKMVETLWTGQLKDFYKVLLGVLASYWK